MRSLYSNHNDILFQTRISFLELSFSDPHRNIQTSLLCIMTKERQVPIIEYTEWSTYLYSHPPTDRSDPLHSGRIESR